MLDLNLLNIFFYVGKNESISLTAKELFVSQPAISQSIKQLEDQIGIKLIVRQSRGVKLTSDGKVLHQICEKITDNLLLFHHTIDNIKALDSGVLRIGASDTICKYYLIEKLKQFEEKYPNIRYRVTNCTTNDSIELLKTGKVDLAFLHTPIKNKELKLKDCMELNDCFICSKEFDASNIKELRDLINYRILLLEKDSYSRLLLDQCLLKYNVILKPKFELASLDLLIEFAKNNMGIICVAEEYVKKELESGELKKINILESLDKRYISLATIEEKYLSTAAHRFIEII